MASASDYRAHAALQPADCLILLPQRLPAAVETSIRPAHYPAECTQSDAFLQPSLRARKGRANSNSLFPWLRHLFADSVYNGPNLREALAKFGKWTIEIVKRAADAAGFQLLPRRWVVERTLAWLNRNRRLAKDFEASIASAKAWVYIASVQLLIRRLA